MMYNNERWAMLATAAGFNPKYTERSTREMARYSIDIIDQLKNALLEAQEVIAKGITDTDETLDAMIEDAIERCP